MAYKQAVTDIKVVAVSVLGDIHNYQALNISPGKVVTVSDLGDIHNKNFLHSF